MAIAVVASSLGDALISLCYKINWGMFRLALSRTLYFAFADAPSRPRVIILSHSNPNAHFAFLQTDLSVVNSRFDAVTLQVGSTALRAFVEELNEKRHVIRKVQRNNYGYKDL